MPASPMATPPIVAPPMVAPPMVAPPETTCLGWGTKRRVSVISFLDLSATTASSACLVEVSFLVSWFFPLLGSGGLAKARGPGFFSSTSISGASK